MEDITLGQKEQLTNWSIQRDALLGEISQLTTEKEKLSKANTEIALSSLDIAKRIEQSIGRMAELDKTEKLYMEIVDSKLPELEKKKTQLEITITALAGMLDGLEITKSKLQKDIEFLTKVQSEVFDRTGILEKVVEHVTNVSSSNISAIVSLFDTMQEKVDAILNLSSDDLEAHKRVLNEIPALFVELRKQSLPREILIKHK